MPCFRDISLNIASFHKVHAPFLPTLQTHAGRCRPSLQNTRPPIRRHACLARLGAPPSPLAPHRRSRRTSRIGPHRKAPAPHRQTVPRRHTGAGWSEQKYLCETPVAPRSSQASQLPRRKTFSATTRFGVAGFSLAASAAAAPQRMPTENRTDAIARSPTAAPAVPGRGSPAAVDESRPLS